MATNGVAKFEVAASGTLFLVIVSRFVVALTTRDQNLAMWLEELDRESAFLRPSGRGQARR